MQLTQENIAWAKGRGFLRNKGTEQFSARVVSIAGIYSSEQLQAIAECAERFAGGKVTFTSRLCAEIPGIPFDKIQDVEQFLSRVHLEVGGTGPKVRPITACKGTVCVFGNIDTQSLAKTLHERFYVGMHNIRFPHKCKIGVGGCPNSCMKPSLNDVGIEGRRQFVYDPEKCRGCAVCQIQKACPVKAVTVCEGKAVLDTSACLNCGVCMGKCPFEAFPSEAAPVCRITVGGTWGKKNRMGTPLKDMVPVNAVPDLVEKILLWYRENGFTGERLAMTMERLGVNTLEDAIAGDDLLLRREEILQAPLKSCME